MKGIGKAHQLEIGKSPQTNKGCWCHLTGKSTHKILWDQKHDEDDPLTLSAEHQGGNMDQRNEGKVGGKIRDTKENQSTAYWKMAKMHMLIR